MKVAIIDYNSGNVQSVLFAINRLGLEATVTADHDFIKSADKVIFPGVGEASTTMETLRKRGLDKIIVNLTQPVLGICLGMQLLCNYSEENKTACLGVFPIQVKRFDGSNSNLKVPHVGWNTLYDISSKIDQSLEDQYMYFVHSYYVELSEYNLASCQYIRPFSAIIGKDNFLATQFHPEKSGSYGAIILKQFFEHMIIYPAIDIIGGHCVRLTQGQYESKKVYSSDPLAIAKEFEDAGFSHLHMVDLDGAKQGRIVNQKILERVASQTNLLVDFGGGIRSKSDVANVLDAGAIKINVGSIAVKEPDLVRQWIEIYGADKIILSADVKGENIAVHGWQDSSGVLINDFISDYQTAGIKTVTCTDIAKDGKLDGASVELYKRLVTKFPLLNIISSGGVDSLENLLELEKIGCSGAIVGKAIYEKKISIEDLVKLNQYVS